MTWTRLTGGATSLSPTGLKDRLNSFRSSSGKKDAATPILIGAVILLVISLMWWFAVRNRSVKAPQPAGRGASAVRRSQPPPSHAVVKPDGITPLHAPSAKSPGSSGARRGGNRKHTRGVAAHAALWDQAPSVGEDKASPQDFFPTISRGVGDKTDRAMADAAKSYDEFQDAMRMSSLGARARDSVSGRGRVAWGKLGKRDPVLFAKHLEPLRAEIQASGQSLEEFLDNQMIPIPEQLAAFYEDAQTDSTEETYKRMRSLRSQELDETMPVRASGDAAYLLREAMQPLPMQDAGVAARRLHEIVRAYVEAKSSGVTLPQVVPDFLEGVQYWAASNTLAAAPAKQLLKYL